MANEVYCSTGTVVGRKTNHDHSVIINELPAICRDVGIDGIEYVVGSSAYDMLPTIRHALSASGLRCAVLHADKNIGILFSQGGAENAKEALRLWRINCELAKEFGTSRVVLHLWGASESDRNFGHNISHMPHILDIAEELGVTTLIENIPCVELDPLSRLQRLSVYDCEFTYDVRFAQLHAQNHETATSELMKSGRISHMHISDFGGGYRDFSMIRPILHPYEGKVNFPVLFDDLAAVGYSGTFTLESPVMYDDGLDLKKLTRSLCWLRREVDRLSNGND